MRPVARVFLAGCVSGALACTQAPASLSAAAQQNVISRSDIERSHVTSVLDAIRRYRSDILVPRAPSSINLDKQTLPVVFIDGQFFGNVDELRNMAAENAEEIRFFNGTDAVRMFGAQYGGGVIQIVSRGS